MQMREPSQDRRTPSSVDDPTRPESQMAAIPKGGAQRGRWSRMGFILAASGSAIGLGNVVFFPANAYRFGGGGFYLPYLLALLVVGLPLMVLELGPGHQQRKAYPLALGRVAGRRGELLGWWALANTTLLTLYYVAILSWVGGMLLGSLGPLWRPSTSLEGFAVESLANPGGFFFSLLSSWRPLGFVLVVWGLNAWVVRRGAASIEGAVRIFVPMMWVLMVLLAVRGLSLDGGVDGMWRLFEPELAAMGRVEVWQGAVSQIFFSLSIGFGVMTTYASYLPRRSDPANGAMVISMLNCAFELVAGLALFALLFVFATVPQASTLSMTFFVLPQGIGQLPGGEGVVASFGVLFFLLLLLAGISSTVSLVESVVAALIDKLGWRRSRVVPAFCALGALGSVAFVLPQVVDPALANDGTLGLTLLDLLDHWVFGYGLLVVGFCQCLLLGRLARIRPLRRGVEAVSRWPLGRPFEILVGWVIPALLAAILCWALWGELRDGLYGSAYGPNFAPGWRWLKAAPLGALAVWLLLPLGSALLLTRLGSRQGGETV